MEFKYVYLICSALTVIFVIACAVSVNKKDGRNEYDILTICLFSSFYAAIWPFFWLFFISYGIWSFFAHLKFKKELEKPKRQWEMFAVMDPYGEVISVQLDEANAKLFSCYAYGSETSIKNVLVTDL